MADAGTSAERFAALVVEARQARGWTQEQLMDATGISKSTLNRWENGRTTTPEPDMVRRVFLALDVDPVEAPIALGYVTRDEVGRDAPPTPIDVSLRGAARLLADPAIPDAAKERLRTVISSAVDFWYEQLGIIRRRPAGRTPSRTPKS